MSASPTVTIEVQSSTVPEVIQPCKIDPFQNDFNDTITAYPREKTMVGLFVDQALKTPGAVALRRHDKVITYKELEEQSNRLANYLVAHGVCNGDNVGLLASRNFDMIIAMLAIMKAGGAYVPIDPEYPIDRQEYILQNSNATVVLMDNDYLLADLLPGKVSVKIREIDANAYSQAPPDVKVNSLQLAYTIYTSGSTGRPKGVMIAHHAAVNLILWVNKQFNIGANDCLLFVTSMCFDLSVYDIFGLLAAGGSIVIADKQEIMSVTKLKELIINNRVTFWDSVPSTIAYFIDELEALGGTDVKNSLRLIFMSGDWIPVGLPGRLKKHFPYAQTISLGGATEGTVWSNFYEIDQVEKSWTSIPYGRPIANNFFYILDESRNPVPFGEAGELYIGGVGVAVGYANDREKTDAAFVTDPFNKQLGGRMYKTGDFGRMLPTMQMEFIGRMDDQVKVRGFRVELGEIAAVLQKHDQVKNTVVLAQVTGNHDKELIAYIVGDVNIAEIKDYLVEKLPFYMVPCQYATLNAIPLTSNGKVDRKALIARDVAIVKNFNLYAAPRTNAEKLLADIWAMVLGLNRVSIYDNFFELGGYSLLAVKVMTKIEIAIGKRLPLASLFENPTIEKMAWLLQIDEKSITWDSLVPIQLRGNKTPLYIVHGAGLNVLLFKAVAMGLSADQPTYGLQAKGLNGIDQPLTRIEDMAAYYIEAILRQNPDGPYALAGFSFGGLIAYEMARQFSTMGKEVKMLAVFDTYAYQTSFFDPAVVKAFKAGRFYLNSLLHTLKFTTGFKNTIVDKTKVIKRKLITRYWTLKHGENQSQPGFFGYAYKIDKCNHIAHDYYRLKPLDIEVEVFKAEKRTFYVDDTAFLGWKPYALKGVNVHNIPGEHNTIFKAPNDKIFAEVLQQCLDKASAGSKASLCKKFA